MRNTQIHYKCRMQSFGVLKQVLQNTCALKCYFVWILWRNTYTLNIWITREDNVIVGLKEYDVNKFPEWFLFLRIRQL
jgi:hypothetical protein